MVQLSSAFQLPIELLNMIYSPFHTLSNHTQNIIHIICIHWKVQFYDRKLMRLIKIPGKIEHFYILIRSGTAVWRQHKKPISEKVYCKWWRWYYQKKKEEKITKIWSDLNIKVACLSIGLYLFLRLSVSLWKCWHFATRARSIRIKRKMFASFSYFDWLYC